MNTLQLLSLKSMPIYELLLIEEMLLRSDTGNWCIINEGSPPAIVMGISGKKEELVNCEKAAKDGIPLIKRFSGGGTVVVDENTLFVTFIFQKSLHSFPAYPEPIMKWTEEIYGKILQHPEFRLRENDYVIGNRKFGGNAQYIKKERWLHHTSLLWDYSAENMQYLLHPKKVPLYREARLHEEFLCRLCEYFPNKEWVINSIFQEMQKRFPTKIVSLKEVQAKKQESSRLSTCFLPLL